MKTASFPGVRAFGPQRAYKPAARTPARRGGCPRFQDTPPAARFGTWSPDGRDSETAGAHQVVS